MDSFMFSSANKGSFSKGIVTTLMTFLFVFSTIMLMTGPAFTIGMVEVTKTAPCKASPGDSIPFKIKVTNNSGADYYNVYVTDSLLGSGWKWDIGTLTDGATKTKTVDYIVPQDAPNPLQNTAIAYGAT
jgi:uncharacterized repeat protein (TIGR01451 family)